MSDAPEVKQADALAQQLGAEVGREAGPQIVEQAREVVLSGAGRSGTQTSEFRMAALGAVAGLVMIALGLHAGDEELRSQGANLTRWAVGAYVLSRGVAKVGPALSKPPAQP